MARTGRPKQPLKLSDEEREVLLAVTRQHTVSQRAVLRARIVLLCAADRSNTDVAAELGVSGETVGKWRRRYLEQGIAGLVDSPRPGRPRRVADETVAELVRTTLEDKPKGATHWSSRGLAKKLGLSQSFVSRTWRTFGLKPHLSETFSLSNDPYFVEKVIDVVGLYMTPPASAVVLCVDEKSQIQALDRKRQWIPGLTGSGERQDPRYQRNGVTSLFAALDIATGHVVGRCFKRHRSKEFLAFLRDIDKAVPAGLQVHLVLDNYGTHKTQAVRNWIVRHPRFHLHFIPTHSSWLNQVESWFAALTTRQLKRGSHRSTTELEAAIQEFLDQHNEEARPFVWRKSADQIFANITALCERILPEEEVAKVRARLAKPILDSPH